MLWRLAKRSRLETDLVVRGKTTASGLCAANHLSPAYFSRIASWKKTSPGGSRLFNCGRFLNFEAFMKMRINRSVQAGTKLFRRISGSEKLPGFIRLALRHLHANASGRAGVAFHAHGREFTN